MNPDQIKENSLYQVLVGQTKLGDAKTALLKVLHWSPESKLWICETESGKEMKVRDTSRFLKEIKPKGEKETKTQTPLKERSSQTNAPQAKTNLGGKEASFLVLQDENRPLRAREISDLAHQRGYCHLPGLTPWATIAAALTTDINVKGKRSRFKKIAPDVFALNSIQHE